MHCHSVTDHALDLLYSAVAPCPQCNSDADFNDLRHVDHDHHHSACLAPFGGAIFVVVIIPIFVIVISVIVCAFAIVIVDFVVIAPISIVIATKIVAAIAAKESSDLFSTRLRRQ